MEKIQVVLDRDKIMAEQRYSYDKMQSAVDTVLVDSYGLIKDADGFYTGQGAPDDYSNFWLAILKLKDQPWFMDNVQSFLWFNSDDSDNPNDFAIEDLRAYYRYFT